MLQDDRTLWNAQFFRQKPAQRGVRLSFDRRRSQLDLDRVAMLSGHFIDLRVRNDVNSNRRHCSMGYPRVHFPIDKSDSIPAQKAVLWTLQN